MIRHEPILAMRQFFSLRFGLILTLILIGIQLVIIAVRVLVPTTARPEPGNLPELSSIFTPEVRHWSPLIHAWASAYNVDPNLIATLIQIESCGDAQAVSRS